MEKHEAIMKAADHIQAHPECFMFRNNGMPWSLDGTGCAMAWVGYFKYRQRFFLFRPWGAFSAGYWLFGGYRMFVDRMNAFPFDRSRIEAWTNDAVECARRLRLYAQKYHAPVIAMRTGIPAEVRKIFTTPRQTISESAVDQKFA